MSRNPGEAFESECVAGLLSFRQHDTTCECRQLTVSSGEVRLDPRRRGGPHAPERAATAFPLSSAAGERPVINSTVDVSR